MRNSVKRRLRFSIGVHLCAVALVALAVAGCGGDAESSATTATAPPGTAPAVVVTVWFADGQGALRTERRELPPGTDPLRGALDELAAGPDDPALIPALPRGTRVLSATADGPLATVDLSEEFVTGYPPGGAAAELAVVGPLVRTAATASGAALVRVLVEGRPPVPAGSQLDFAQPLAPGDLPPP